MGSCSVFKVLVEVTQPVGALVNLEGLIDYL